MPQTVKSSWLSKTLAIAEARSGWSWTTSTRTGLFADGLKPANARTRMATETPPPLFGGP